jgi:hypothetical protein
MTSKWENRGGSFVGARSNQPKIRKLVLIIKLELAEASMLLHQLLLDRCI